MDGILFPSFIWGKIKKVSHFRSLFLIRWNQREGPKLPSHHIKSQVAQHHRRPHITLSHTSYNFWRCRPSQQDERSGQKQTTQNYSSLSFKKATASPQVRQRPTLIWSTPTGPTAPILSNSVLSSAQNSKISSLNLSFLEVGHWAVSLSHFICWHSSSSFKTH